MSLEDQGDRHPLHSAAAFDLVSLQSRLGGDKAAADAVLRAFAREAPRQIERLRAAVAAGASDQVRLMAHAFKGSLLWIGASAAAASAHAMELNPSADSPIAAGTALLKLSEDVERLLLEVRSRFVVLPD